MGRMIGILIWILPVGIVAGQTGPSPSGPGQQITLQALEQLALANNPTLAQARAEIEKAEGGRRQAGLYPNPEIGYGAEELGGREQSGEHQVFVEQRIVTAGKLAKARRVLSGEKSQAEAQLKAQEWRVRNSVRQAYYQVLGRQKELEIAQQLVSLAEEVVTVSGQLFNVGAADRPDVLEAEVEAQRLDLQLFEARQQVERSWIQLAAVVGLPAMERLPLAGDLEAPLTELDRDSLLAALLSGSPEIEQARAGVEKAKSALDLARSRPVPDLFIRGGLGYNRELVELDQPVGRQGFVEFGVQIPLFDRNQGGKSAAQAEIVRSEQELRRLELLLRSRLEDRFTRYLILREVVGRYRDQILPRAQSAYSMYLEKFRQMAASYPQVLIAQRTLFESRKEYVRSLIAAWQSAAELEGFLLTGGLGPLHAPLESSGPMPEGVLPDGSH